MSLYNLDQNVKCILPQLIKEAIYNSHVVRIKFSSLTVSLWVMTHDSRVYFWWQSKLLTVYGHIKHWDMIRKVSSDN